ncbi:hypothetical protein H072_3376 [Dactylellina haptotyla CBS 200.50]|uniref:mannan endo-1,4-beta-mannosidase n=1 Tax=Dactylellina haptotyla (strain CBS 200.50) TaxID=1284197 RepID=S8AI97_DACHA|nr:hypothetical protein H072_3376 [Dactylellina haptotyla CBS 200.50]
MYVKQAVLIAAAASMVAANPVPAHTPPGKKRDFPYANGNKFGLNGLDFYFAGSNAYYLPFSNNYADNLAGLTAARKVGLKVMRTWCFNDRNATFDPNGLPKYYPDDTGTWFTEWNNGAVTINTGADGLQKLDAVVKAAEDADMKLVMTLTNNWADYGGMDMYTINLGYKYHDDFYTKPEIISKFKDYIKVVVQRYKNSKAIFSWQLGNEPRCGADGTRNLPRSPDCNVATIHAWVLDISAYIKSLDPDHMVSVGSEGAFNHPSDPDWAYNGADGTDFEGELAAPNVDYGTFHLYPDWWSKTPAWGTQWIKDHAAAGRAANKPVVFEEYGWLTPDKRLEYLGQVSPYTRLEVIKEWQETSIAELVAGDQYWQFGWYGWSYGPNYNDGFTIYLNDTEAGELVNKHARHVSALNHK